MLDIRASSVFTRVIRREDNACPVTLLSHSLFRWTLGYNSAIAAGKGFTNVRSAAALRDIDYPPS